MKDFNLKSYHIRGMNAASEEEKLAINQELKDLYASLSEEDKVDFNEQLQTFIIKEMAAIKSVYDAAQSDDLN
ncbi:hypothetical protein Emtol_3277 [Emticicia oligotrophica DSM 17448]|uniref:Uncharacterized protein n=1 Tax=Emticicia oligotrophica (strain DSM 17448 / CIP 109782 / MTCC 6937 / GPTSA100-15) TaxID=929562 RepID=A0ABM5N4P2_EMTOG|nr:hypothetical protein [Emticicia oligotrophica]AFK04406.1 hypothetical protein Emtol_3277 [Emticicia oligotrophica DSM 17448]